MWKNFGLSLVMTTLAASSAYAGTGQLKFVERCEAFCGDSRYVNLYEHVVRAGHPTRCIRVYEHAFENTTFGALSDEGVTKLKESGKFTNEELEPRCHDVAKTSMNSSCGMYSNVVDELTCEMWISIPKS